MNRFAGILVGLSLVCCSSRHNAQADDPAAAKPKATHKQIRSLRPEHNGEPIHLNTYCLSPAGDILACVGGANTRYKQDANGNYTAESVNSDSFVQVYGPEGELKAEWPVPFKPTAINMAPDQTLFVAGEGKIARLNLKGEILTTASIPNIGDPDKLREEAIAKLKAQSEEMVARLQKQMDFAKEQAAKIEETPAEERTASQKARLKAYGRQLELYTGQLEALQDQEPADPAVAISNASNVTALAVSDTHVFVCARSAAGNGYDVHRCDFDFQNPLPVLSGLSGCCGQMDIQAYKDKLLTAENGKFQVGIYDEAGASLDSFGGRDRTGGAGFGSCCNPMNVRCCSNGDILTAESSIGDIKRFSADGEYLGYIGRAKISGGCKHVAVAWDEQRDRYYFMNVSDSSICVLVPLAEAPEFTEDELLAKAAREGLGQNLVGSWSIPGTKAPAPTNRSALVDAVRNLLGAEGDEDTAVNASTNVAFERVVFAADGKCTISGGMYGQWNVDNWTWAPVRQDADKQTVDFELQTDGVAYQTFRAELKPDDAVTISVVNGGQLMMSGEYRRDAAAESAPVAANE